MNYISVLFQSSIHASDQSQNSWSEATEAFYELEQDLILYAHNKY